MPVSTFDRAREALRQQAADDDLYFRKMFYFFELEIPQNKATSGGNRFLYPLVINPESYSLSEPFSVEPTKGQHGGLFVEENGVIERLIRLRGHTGFKPRQLPVGFPGGTLRTIFPEKRGYTRVLKREIVEALSGQRHFQYLQDVVFRTYSDYKQDPATAEDTRLYFHVPKDGEHWEVKPQKFDLERSARGGPLYNYSIELLVVGPAGQSKLSFSEDKEVLDYLRDGTIVANAAQGLISGGLYDLVELEGEIKIYASSVTAAISNTRQIVQATNALLNGTAELIALPHAWIRATSALIEDTQRTLETANDFGYLATHKIFAAINEGLDLLGAHPEMFLTSVDRTLRDVKDQQELVTALSQGALAEATRRTRAQTFQALASLGSGPSAGEAMAAYYASPLGRRIQTWTGARDYRVAAGDSLVGLASRFLGDARRWQEIAVLNGLKPPFVNDQASARAGVDIDDLALDGVLSVGATILIPTLDTPVQAKPDLPVLGVEASEIAEVHFLGRDLLFEEDRAGLFDLVVDDTRGATDLRLVQGVENLRQGIVQRTRIQRGTDIMYRNLGVQRVVGLSLAPVDLELVRFRLIEAVELDPRISGVNTLRFDAQADALDLEIVAGVHGFTQSTQVQTTIKR